MACLAYSPSPIMIDSNQYRREELLEFTTNILQGVKKQLQVPGNESSNRMGEIENLSQVENHVDSMMPV